MREIYAVRVASVESTGAAVTLGRLAGWSTLANNGCSPNHFGKERTRARWPSSSMARLLSAAARPRSPIHTAVSVFGSLLNGDVDAEPGVAQAQIRLGEYEPEVAQLLGGPAEAEMDHGAAGWQRVGLDGGSHPPHEQPGIGCLLEDRASQPALAPDAYLSDDRPELLPGGCQVVLAALAVRALSALHDSRTLELA